MRKIFLIIIILLGFVMQANAQLYYFVKSGTEVSESSTITMVYIRGLKCCVRTKKAREITSKLHSDSFYWEEWMKKQLAEQDEPYTYDSSLTTSSYKVYKGVGI